MDWIISLFEQKWAAQTRFKLGTSVTWILCSVSFLLNLSLLHPHYILATLILSTTLSYLCYYYIKPKKKNIGKKRMLSIFFTESVFSTQTTFWPLFSSQLLSLIFFTATFPSAKKNIGEKGIYSNIFLKSWQQHLQTYMSQYVDFMGRVADQHSILFMGRQLSYVRSARRQFFTLWIFSIVRLADVCFILACRDLPDLVSFTWKLHDRINFSHSQIFSFFRL